MALDSLTAKANTGTGTDSLAGRSTAAGFVGAVMLTSSDGSEIGLTNGLPVRFATATAVPALSRVTASGSTTAGAFRVSVRNSGGADATFAGGTLKSGESLEVVPPTGQVLAAIAYDATGTELTLLQVTDGTSGGGGS